jgi:translation initiation factor IF-3
MISAKIGQHDFMVKADRAKEFLEKGYKVKVSLRFRGREVTHQAIGRNLMEKMADTLAAAGKVESLASADARNMILVMSPK